MWATPTRANLPRRFDAILPPVRSLGADVAIDHTREDFTHSATCYDVIIGGAANFYWTVSAHEELSDLLRKGTLRVVDRSYPLHEAALAHGYVEHGHKRANVVLTLDYP